MTVLAMSAAAGSVSSNTVVPGVLGFLVVAGMSVALYFLFRSLNTQLRKVAPPPPAKPRAAGPASPGPAKPGPARDDGDQGRPSSG